MARPFSTFGQATVLAQYLTVLAVGVITYGLLLDGFRMWVRVAAFSYASLLLLGAAATGTRSAIFGLISGVGLLVVLTWITNPSRRLRIVSLLSAAALVGGVALTLVVTPLGARVLSTVDSTSETEELITRLRDHPPRVDWSYTRSGFR